MGLYLLISSASQVQYFLNPIAALPFYTIATNPLHVLQVHRQSMVFESIPTYKEVSRQIGYHKLFTLGLAPSFLKNGIVLGCLGQQQSYWMGDD